MMLHVGFGNIVDTARLVAISMPTSNSIRRTITIAKNEGKCVDMTAGRLTKAVLIMDNGHIILSSLTPETIATRIGGNSNKKTVHKAIEAESGVE